MSGTAGYELLASDSDEHEEERKKEKSSKKRKHILKDDRRERKERKKEKSSKHRKHSSKEDKREHKGKSKHEKRKHKEYSSDSSDVSSDDSGDDRASRKAASREQQETKRKEAGLEWMNLAPERPPAPKVDEALRLEPEKPVSTIKELNPYWKNDGHGLPTEEEKGGLRGGNSGKLPPPPGVGDGGASWRMKALKRAQEAAAREGRQLDEVVEERWGSLASLTNSVSVQRAAHANAHLHAKRDRTKTNEPPPQKAPIEGEDADDRRIRTGSRDYLKDVKAKDNRMREPQVDRKLSWRNRGSIRPEDAAVLAAAAQTYNKFSNDGSFLKNAGTSVPREESNPRVSTVTSTTTTTTTRVEYITRTVKEVESTATVSRVEAHRVRNETPTQAPKSEPVARVDAQSAAAKNDMEPPSTKVVNVERKSEGSGVQVQNLSSNQIAAKVMQLRLRGKHKEADELQKQGENVVRDRPPPAPEQQEEEREERRPFSNPTSVLARLEALGKKTLESRRESADKAMAGMIGKNKLYKADDEYDDLGPQADKKKKTKPGKQERVQSYNRIQTQAERCQLCFDNPNRPKHLTMAIANYTYLALPPRRPLVDGHCYIIPMVHEGSTRNVDDGTWEELRNFKKCLVKMFSEQKKDAIFLETAMHLARQKRHCLVECIPIPTSFARDAPLYFKKAIDEAESEWSQHNAKRLIDTSTRGLRSSVPKNFPYFHVEFGMNGGYAHVIDDETKFKPDFGRVVLEGMLEIEEEDFYAQALSRKDQEKLAKDFAKMWEPHDWTKMLDQ